MTTAPVSTTPELFGFLYSDLRRVAGRLMRGEQQDTLQPTALVHEAYLRMAEFDRCQWQNGMHFVGAAARMMRFVLVDRARKRRATKNGGGAAPVRLDPAPEISIEREADLIAMDDALTELARFDLRASQLVELKFFGGLTTEEAAAVLQISRSTAKRDWDSTKAWLQVQIERSR